MDIARIIQGLLAQQAVQSEPTAAPPVPPRPNFPINEGMPVPPNTVSPVGGTKDRVTDPYKLKLMQLLQGGALPDAPEFMLRGGMPDPAVEPDLATRLAMLRGAK